MESKVHFINIIRNKQEGITGLLCAGIVLGLIFSDLLMNMSVIGLFIYWLLFAKKNFTITPEKKWFLLFSSLFFVVCISAIYSSDQTIAISRIIRRLPLLLFPLIFGTSDLLTTSNNQRIQNTFIWATTAACIVSLVNGFLFYWKEGSFDLLHGYGMLTVLDVCPFLFGIFCTLSLIILFVRLYSDFKIQGKLRLVFTTVIPLLVLLLFVLLLSNRSVLLFLVAIIVLFIFKLIRSIGKQLFFLTSLLIIFISAIQFNPSMKRQWDDMVDFSEKNRIELDEDRSLGRSWGGKSIRIAIWQCSLDVIKKNWLLGVGIGDVQNSLQDSYESRKFYFASRYNRYNAHNQYIQEALGQGLIGLIMLLSCIFAPLIYFLRKNKALSYILFLLSFAFICFTESFLEISQGVVWFSFMNSILFKQFSKTAIL